MPSLLYATFCIMSEDEWSVANTSNCFVRKDMFHMKECQNVVWVSSTELEESLLNGCNEAPID